MPLVNQVLKKEKRKRKITSWDVMIFLAKISTVMPSKCMTSTGSASDSRGVEHLLKLFKRTEFCRNYNKADKLTRDQALLGQWRQPETHTHTSLARESKSPPPYCKVPHCTNTKPVNTFSCIYCHCITSGQTALWFITVPYFYLLPSFNLISPRLA